MEMRLMDRAFNEARDALKEVLIKVFPKANVIQTSSEWISIEHPESKVRLTIGIQEEFPVTKSDDEETVRYPQVVSDYLQMVAKFLGDTKTAIPEEPASDYFPYMSRTALEEYGYDTRLYMGAVAEAIGLYMSEKLSSE